MLTLILDERLLFSVSIVWSLGHIVAGSGMYMRMESDH